MTMKVLQTLVLLLVAINGSHGGHFRGGSMSWKPKPGNKVELTYRVSFKFRHTEPKFDPCTVEAAAQQTVLHTSGKLLCDGCVSGQTERPLDYICTSYDAEQDWSIGNYVLEYDVPPGQNAFSISYESCCWLKVVSPDLGSGSRSWNMETEVNVKPRKEADGSVKINSSPVTSAIPIEKFQLGCTYNLKIAVSDPDNDIVKCKYMTPDECTHKGASVRACGKPTRGLTVNKDCSLVFNAATAGVGAHAVNVMIRDCPNAKCKKPYSKVPLLFLLSVEGGGDKCIKPSIIIPPSCKAIPPNQPFEMDIIAEAGDESKPISRIVSQKPFGMEETPIAAVEGSSTQKSITLSWTPTSDQLGEHSLCFSALDSDGFTSGRYCTFIIVSDQPPLRPDPEASTPAPNAEHGTDEKWQIRFTSEIDRPRKPAFIRIEDESGAEIYKINVLKSTEVAYVGNTIEFTPPQSSFPFNAAPTPYTVKLGEGVAIPKTGGGCMSEAAEWQVMLKDNANFAILPMQHCIASSYMGPVDPDTCDIFVREMLPDESGEAVPTGYNLCCTCIGPSSAPGRPAGPPAGPPGVY